MIAGEEDQRRLQLWSTADSDSHGRLQLLSEFETAHAPLQVRAVLWCEGCAVVGVVCCGLM